MIRGIIILLYQCLWVPDNWIILNYNFNLIEHQLKSSFKKRLQLKEHFEKNKQTNKTRMLQVKAHANDNHRLLSYHDNGFWDTIIILTILLHITKSYITIIHLMHLNSVMKTH